MEQQQTPAERGGRRFHLNPAIVAAVIGAVVVAFIGYWLLRTPKGPQITYPEEGQKVGHKVTVRGTASVQDEEHLWVIVRKDSDRDKYKPEENRFEWISKTEGAWKWPVSIGSRDNPKIGDAYNIIVVKLPDGVCQEIETYRKRAEDYNKAKEEGQKPSDGPPLGLDHLPCGAQIVDSVKVIRR